MFDLNNKETLDAMNICDRMYAASFRSEPYVLSAEMFEEYSDGLLDDLIIANFCKVKGIDFESLDIESMEYITDEAENMFYSKFPNFKLAADSLVVDLCNYKGEGEGLALYEPNKALPVFVSKSQSYFQV